MDILQWSFVSRTKDCNQPRSKRKRTLWTLMDAPFTGRPQRSQFPIPFLGYQCRLWGPRMGRKSLLLKNSCLRISAPEPGSEVMTTSGRSVRWPPGPVLCPLTSVSGLAHLAQMGCGKHSTRPAAQRTMGTTKMRIHRISFKRKVKPPLKS